MQTNPKVYRFSGLVAVLGLLTLLAGLIVMLLLPSIRYAAWGTLALGILLLTIAFIIDFRQVSRALTGRRGKFGVSTTVMASIFIGIILFVNAISIGNYHRFDITGVAQFTLASQTKEVLKKLEAPVQIMAFYIPGDPLGNSIINFLNEYQNYSDQLNLKTIDPDEHPDQARQYGINLYPTVVFESQGRVRLVLPQEIFAQVGQQITAEMEHPFTSAILEVTGTVQKKVYFLTGHGESNINSSAPNGYSRARDGLLDNLYKVATLNLLVTPSIPEDATALIIAAPQTLTSGEVDIIERYLENGGWLMILTNPESPPEIKQLVSSWGVEIEDGTVIDPSSFVDPNKDMPLVTWQRNFFRLPEIYFPGATAIIPKEDELETIIIIREPLFWTSEESWLERDFDPLKEPVFNEEIDRKGPLAMGVLIAAAPTAGTDGEPTEEIKLTRLVVIGDSDFASNSHFYSGNNSDLFLNSVEILTAGTELISIERKVLSFRRLVVGPEERRFINYSSIGLLPLLVLIIGSIIWWRRR